MAVASLAFVVWGFGILISIVFGWPAQFGEPGDPDNVAGLCILAALTFVGSLGEALVPPRSTSQGPCYSPPVWWVFFWPPRCCSPASGSW